MFKRAFAIGVLLSAMSLSTGASADGIRFGAGQQGSQNYGVNAALAQAIGTETGRNVTVQAFGGPTAYLPLVNSGELDMAAVVTPDLGDAIRGTGPFQGVPHSELRVVVALLPSPVGLMVRADSGINTISDLKGKRVAWGVPAQASLQPYFAGALANGGLREEDVATVPVSSVANGVSALVSGSVDATLFALRGGAVVEADSAVGGIRWLPFDDSAEAVKRMQEMAPEAYIFDVSADAGVVGAKSAFKTMAYDYVLITRADFDAEAVSAVAKLVKEQTTKVASSNDILRAMTVETVKRNYPNLPVHDAAALAQ